METKQESALTGIKAAIFDMEPDKQEMVNRFKSRFESILSEDPVLATFALAWLGAELSL